jgi:uncharacterized membrane protein YebE (DUF533 family)
MLGLGGRWRGTGGKLGMAALGYMAYRAYQGRQDRSGAAPAGTTGTGTGTGTSRGGIGGFIQGVADRFTGGDTAAGRPPASGAAASPEMREDERAVAEFSDDKALLLIRAMVAAGYSDGALAEAERLRILEAIDEAGGDAADRQIMEREIANPRPLDELLLQVNDPDTAQEFYLAARAAIDGQSDEHRAWLADLRRRLQLSEQQVHEVEELAS